MGVLMKNILLRGMDNNQKNLNEMKMILEGKIGEVVLFGDYVGRDSASIIENVEERFDEIANGEEVNLICHSMGCNYGAILGAIRSSQVKHLVLMSPEIYPVSLEEKMFNFGLRTDKEISLSKETSEIKTKRSIFEMVDEVHKFKKSAKLAREILADQTENDIKCLVMYGMGDKFVSQNSIFKLIKNYSEVTMNNYPTTCHNLLLSYYGSHVAEDIKKYILK